jgi:hypothetical protein
VCRFLKKARRLSGIAGNNVWQYYVSMRSISLKLADDLLAELASQAKAGQVTKSQLEREGLEKRGWMDLRGGPKSSSRRVRGVSTSSKGSRRGESDWSRPRASKTRTGLWGARQERRRSTKSVTFFSAYSSEFAASRFPSTSCQSHLSLPASD